MVLLRGAHVWIGFSQKRGDARHAAGGMAVRTRRFGWLEPVAGAALAAIGVASCAVGPDFHSPPPPPVAGYTPGASPVATTSAEVAGGAAQKFAMGGDIPGEWWKVFHSRELDGLIAEALAANPSLQAAQASLWQAKENLYAQQGKLLPSVDANSSAERQQFSPAEF